VEVNTSSGEVFDKDIKHGISQLKYALPYVIRNAIEHNLNSHIDDAGHNFIIPILVTNADLFLLKETFSIEMLKTTNSVEELSTKVPNLIYYYDNGPEFKVHHRDVFKNFEQSYIENRNIKEIEKRQRSRLKKDKFYHSPKDLCFDLLKPDNWTLDNYYSQFFICDFGHFEDLTKAIVNAIRLCIK
jgi:hypothetical protein